MRISTCIPLIFALTLVGCNSTIKEYDQTFTGTLSSKTLNASVPELKSTGLKLASAKAGVSKLNKPYFVEFRARNALTYGHVTVVFGKLDKNGNLPVNKDGVLDPSMVQISGLHPATPSSVPWSVGHVVPVPAETGPSDGDFEEKYVLSRYRIDLTKDEFQKLVRIVSKKKSQNKLWYALFTPANCIGYLASIAKEIGLKIPLAADVPGPYVSKLKAINVAAGQENRIFNRAYESNSAQMAKADATDAKPEKVRKSAAKKPGTKKSADTKPVASAAKARVTIGNKPKAT